MKVVTRDVPTNTKYGDIEIEGVPFEDVIELSQWNGEIGQSGRNTLTISVSEVHRLANTLDGIATDFRRYGSPSWSHPLRFIPQFDQESGA